MKLLNARQSTNTSLSSNVITTVEQPFRPACCACSSSLVSASSCVDRNYPTLQNHLNFIDFIAFHSCCGLWLLPCKLTTRTEHLFSWFDSNLLHWPLEVLATWILVRMSSFVAFFQAKVHLNKVSNRFFLLFRILPAWIDDYWHVLVGSVRVT